MSVLSFVGAILLTALFQPRVCQASPFITIRHSGTISSAGDLITISLRVGGLSSAPLDSLGGFDIDLKYDNSVLEFNSVSFIDPVSNRNELDLPNALFAFAGDVLVLPTSRLDLFGVSGNSVDDLDVGQAAEFDFATLEFRALGVASSRVEIDLADPNLLLLDADFGDLPIVIRTGVVVVPAGGTPVPEVSPRPAVLVAFSLILWVFGRRRRFAA